MSRIGIEPITRRFEVDLPGKSHRPWVAAAEKKRLDFDISRNCGCSWPASADGTPHIAIRPIVHTRQDHAAAVLLGCSIQNG